MFTLSAAGLRFMTIFPIPTAAKFHLVFVALCYILIICEDIPFDQVESNDGVDKIRKALHTSDLFPL